MPLALLLVATALLVEPSALDPLRSKESLLLFGAPLVFLPSLLRGHLRTAARIALPRPLLALARLLLTATVLTWARCC